MANIAKHLVRPQGHRVPVGAPSELVYSNRPQGDTNPKVHDSGQDLQGVLPMKRHLLQLVIIAAQNGLSLALECHQAEVCRT